MKVTLKQLPEFAREVRARLVRLPNKVSASMVFLRGELGSGKTTFMQALAKELGVAQNVQSPTYVLMKKYQTADARFKTLVHIDAYRLGGAKEFEALKPAEFLSDPNTLVCVEWPERVGGALPKPDLTLTFSHEGASESERYIDAQ